MVLRQPRTSCNNGLPIRRLSPARALKDNRCLECPSGTPSDTHHAACLQNDFAPTPNRFGVLAGLNPSPETKWAFDYVPTSKSSTRKRGKRGGRQKRLKHTAKTTCEKPEADGVDELCDRFAALHLDDNAPTAAPRKTDHRPPSGATSDLNIVTHHWAPQFRPDSLSTSPPARVEPTNIPVTTLSQKPTLDQGPSTDVPTSTRKLSPTFPLSAFLKDLASPTDCAGYWPRSPAPGSAPPPRISNSSSRRSAPPLLTPALPAGNCSLNIRSSNTALHLSNAIESQRAVPTTSLLSTNAALTYKSFPAFGVVPFTPLSESISTTSPAPFPLPPPAKQSIVSTPSPPEALWAPTSTMLTTIPPAPQRSSGSWQETSEGITVFHPSPKALITAPVASPYPFVYPPRPWTPSAVPNDLFKNTAAVPMRLKSKFTFTPDPPGRRIIQKEFLKMGHAPECWCDSHKQALQAKDLAVRTASGEGSSTGTVPLDDANTLRPQMRTMDARRMAHTSSSGTADIPVDVIVHSKDSPSAESPADFVEARLGGAKASLPMDNSHSDISSLDKAMETLNHAIVNPQSEMEAAGLIGDLRASPRRLANLGAADAQAAHIAPGLSCAPSTSVRSRQTIGEFMAQIQTQRRASPLNTTMNGPQAPVETTMTDSDLDYLPASSPVAIPRSSHAGCNLTDLGEDLESDSSDGDAVMGTPSSEGAYFDFQGLATSSSEGMGSEFEGLEVIEGVPVDSDEDWTTVSPNLHARRTSSSLSLRTVSNASMQNPSAPLIVSSSPVTLPSPPRTPSFSPYPARVSDDWSEGDYGSFRS
ncbi:uncharacterized protein M421DRAFT_89304 [Didymella exigua CBS 183.55]|uniref:Uncharacterized protein n=1 Tax=Didymella exigua CBS 183.55 TaxID=1150837 RepID=A0A6A5S0L7_9PLEO|nr:uncharacterized protein M421DRAFT_89304 [Didymella exigua CBS 183.55]KAF1933004.1 hypothetical protein M421DRAFT_89304 [Didymella exigua CBS 183.55]